MNRNDLAEFANYLSSLFKKVTKVTDELVRFLSVEDQMGQSMEDASPLNWHRAHTAWFYETFVLAPHLTGYKIFDENYSKVLNSYYVSLGARHKRAARGLLTRPTVGDVEKYRRSVVRHVGDALMHTSIFSLPVLELIELGIQHEQQHQELMVTDIKHLFSQNPLRPQFHKSWSQFVLRGDGDVQCAGVELAPGLVDIGHTGGGFSFDNEGSRHKVYLPGSHISPQLINNRQWIDFIEDLGYRRPDYWLSLGWDWVERERWEAPLYWSREGDTWYVHDFDGYRPVDLYAPVSHISYFEAEAFARWKGARLPTEFELETAIVRGVAERGKVWEWSSSSYAPYPGYKPTPGAIGEYNGKFMCNQYVLRGGSIATPPGHVRPSYRNFFPPEVRWQFSGLRLARDM